jgi:hypothetical protein
MPEEPFNWDEEEEVVVFLEPDATTQRRRNI